MLRAFPVDDTVAFFREIGVSLHEEAGGKLFPDTNRARDVLDALLRERDRVGATLAPGHRVRRRRARDTATADFVVDDFDAATLSRAAVVLATGGQSLPKTGSDGAGFEIARALGHTIVAPTPALAPLLLDAGRRRFTRESVGCRTTSSSTIWIDGARRRSACAARCSGRISASAARSR